MKTKKLKIDTFLPIFPGFYGTIFEASNEECEIEEINRIRLEKGLEEITFDDVVFDYEEHNNSVAKGCVNFIEKELNTIFKNKLEITFEKLVSPKYYNYSNDSINISIDIDKKLIKEIKNYLTENIEEFESYLVDRYKSCSGFISFYSHDPNVWIKEYMEQIEENEHILGAVLNFILLNEDSDVEMDMYGSISDNYVFATNFDELIEE